MEQADIQYRKTPEDMFLVWFLRLPHTADVAKEARIAIARLDAENSDSEVFLRLRGLLLQASSGLPAMPRSRSRSRH